MRSVCLITILLFGFYTETIHAQAPGWDWVQSTEGNGPWYSETGIGTDKEGNVYLAGNFTSSSITFGNTTLTNPDSGNNTMFIVKFDSSGHVIWAQNSSGAYLNTLALANDSNGNIYMAGNFSGHNMFVGHDTLANTGLFCVFVIKYDPSGNVLWTRTAVNDTGYYTPVGISSDVSGNVFITGAFTPPYMIFGNDTLAGTEYPGFFVTKYDSSGTFVWAHTADGNYSGNTYSSMGIAVSNDSWGNVIITGAYNGNNIVIGNDSLINEDFQNNMFVAKYDPSGNVIWATGPWESPIDQWQAGNIVPYANSVDANGNIYVTGQFSDTMKIGSYTFISSNQDYTYFIAKYDPAGHVTWAVSYDNVVVNDIRTDIPGNLYVSGSFFSPYMVFGPDTLFDPDTAYDSQNTYVVKYDPSGHVIWVKTTGVFFHNSPTSVCATNVSKIAVNNMGNLFITGSLTIVSLINGNDTLSGNVAGNFVFGNDTLTCLPGNTDLFIAKLDTSINLTKYTSIVPITPSSPITVYPNPSGGVFYFSGIASGSTIEVYDLLGQSVMTSPQPLSQGEGLNSQYIVDLSGRQAGVYFYRVTDTNNSSHQGKIVVE